MEKNSDYIAKIVSGINQAIPASTLSQKKQLSFKSIALTSTLLLFIVTPIIEYVFNPQQGIVAGLVQQLFSSSSQENESAAVRKKELVKAKQAKEDRLVLEKQIKKLEGRLEKSDTTLKILKEDIASLTQEKKKNEVDFFSVRTEFEALKTRKKKLDTFAKQLMEEKETIGKDIGKLLKHRFEAEKKKITTEKAALEKKIVETENALKLARKNAAAVKPQEQQKVATEVNSKEVKKLEEKIRALKENTFYNNGTFYQDMNRFDEAILSYKNALKINPLAADAQYNIAIIFDRHLKKKKRALFHYKRYLELSPGAKDAEEIQQWIQEIEVNK